MENQEFVYHASKAKGLKKLEPRKSTHKKPWVYATKDITTAAMFLGDNYDFIVQTHLNKGGSPCMYERFEGALEHAYKGKSGSIYKLSADGFMEESAISSGELVSEEETDVIEEIEVEDALEYLENLEAEGKLRIYRYPEIPEGFPKDKSDIVEKAVQWTIDFGEHILDEVEKYHPDVLERVLNDLKYRGYKVKGEYNI